MGYQPKTYRDQGGDRQVIASGGTLLVQSGATLTVEDGSIVQSVGTLAAAGADATDAAAIVTEVVAVTAADNAKGVALPAAVAGLTRTVINTSASARLLVYPVNGGNDQINGLAEDAAFTVQPGETAVFVCTSATQWYVRSQIVGIAAGYALARGQHTTVDEDDTVATGLATVVSAVASLEADPLDTVGFVTCVIGNQAGAPAAGSIQIKTWKVTTGGAAGNPTQVAASAFSKKVNWIAIGTR